MRQRLKWMWEKAKRNQKRRKLISRLYNFFSRNRMQISGKNNHLEISDSLLLNVTIDIGGSDNKIELGTGCRISNTLIRIRGNGHVVSLGENCTFQGGNIWIEDENCTLTIGDGTTVVEAEISVTEPGSKVEIGPECMFAHGIEIRSGDSHSIIDRVNGERINFARDVKIGRHVWLAADAMILKGVVIGEDCVVASRALVTKSFRANTLIGGSPAKAMKENISWKRERIYTSTK